MAPPEPPDMIPPLQESIPWSTTPESPDSLTADQTGNYRMCPWRETNLGSPDWISASSSSWGGPFWNLH